MNQDKNVQPKKRFRLFFVRGLGILLPTVLTIYLLVLAYNFLVEIATPINSGVRWVILHVTTWPAGENIEQRSENLDKLWSEIGLGNWVMLDLIGLLIAIVIIYLIGVVLGSFIGRRVYAKGEELLLRIPGIKQVYPYVKQVTDFFFSGTDEKATAKFRGVVAVEYPRKGIWSMGLLTGDTMRTVQSHAGEDCVTVFIPSSPTPITGYVITVPRQDTITLPISIDDALRFAVSAGVIVPINELVEAARGGKVMAELEKDGGLAQDEKSD